MDLFDLRLRVKETLALALTDPEAFHGKADELMEEVLRAIALGDPTTQEMAQAVVPLLSAGVAKWFA